MYSISGGREPGVGGIPARAVYRKSLRSGSPNGVCPVGAAVARVKGTRHACGVNEWAAFAVKSGGTANPFVLL